MDLRAMDLREALEEASEQLAAARDRLQEAQAEVQDLERGYKALQVAVEVWHGSVAGDGPVSTGSYAKATTVTPGKDVDVLVAAPPFEDEESDWWAGLQRMDAVVRALDELGRRATISQIGEYLTRRGRDEDSEQIRNALHYRAKKVGDIVRVSRGVFARADRAELPGTVLTDARMAAGGAADDRPDEAGSPAQPGAAPDQGEEDHEKSEAPAGQT